MKNLTLGLVLASCIVSAGFAQEIPAYEETGVISMTIGSEDQTLYTTWNTVPGDPGREIHTASWLILEPMLLGGIKLSTDDVLVTVTARDTVLPKSDRPEMRVQFGLDPVTLELNPELGTELTYSRDGTTYDGYYALTSGEIRIESVMRIDENNLAIIATAEGELSWQEGLEIIHNPDDVLALNARFDLKRVVNRGKLSLP